MHIITSTDILLPRAEDMSAWSVIACDQFTAEPDYWAAAEKLAAEKPSTLSLMLPEAWLHTARAEGADRRIADTMRRYLAEGVFQTIPDSLDFPRGSSPVKEDAHMVQFLLDSAAQVVAGVVVALFVYWLNRR